MRCLGLTLWLFAAVSLVATVFIDPSRTWVAAVLLGIALSFSMLRRTLYRPPENHLGVIYRFGRFSQVVGPDEWVLVIPLIEDIRAEISLHPRRVDVELSDLLTRDGVRLDSEMAVYYMPDLRTAQQHFRSQALAIPAEGWDSIVRTVLLETVSEAIAEMDLQSLLTPRGRSNLKQILSALLADRVRGLGLIVNPQTGVSLQVLRPTIGILEYRQPIDSTTSDFGTHVLRLVEAFQEKLMTQIEPLDSPSYLHGLDAFGVYTMNTGQALRDTRLPSNSLLIACKYDSAQRIDLVSDLLNHLQELGSPNPLFLMIVPDEGERIQQLQQTIRDRISKVRAVDVVVFGHYEILRLLDAKDPHATLRKLMLPHVDLLSVSLFTVNGPTPDTMFFGREPELREIVEHAQSASYAVIGGRRIGKTSILLHLHHTRLPAAGFRTVFHDCSTTPSHDDLLAASIRDCRPESLWNGPGTFGALLDSPPNDAPLVVLLDEVDKVVPIDRADNWRLFRKLRALATDGRAQLVFSGERTLRDAMQDPKSPLFNFANEMLVGRLDYRAVEELITRPMKQLEIELVSEGEIVNRIWAFTSGHPNVIQRLCRRLIERLNERGTRSIVIDDVNAVIEDPRFQEVDFLHTYWEAATPLERIITLGLSHEARTYRLKEVRLLLSEQAHIQPSATATKEALDRLVDLRSILKRSQAGYSFAVEAFPRVLANTTTVEDLLEVLAEQYEQEEAQA